MCEHIEVFCVGFFKGLYLFNYVVKKKHQLQLFSVQWEEC